MSITRYRGVSALAMQPESTEWEPSAVMEQADDGAWVLYKDHAAEIEALKMEGIARLEREDRVIVTDEMLAQFNSESAFCGFHSGLWSYKCPVCREWNRGRRVVAS